MKSKILINKYLYLTVVSMKITLSLVGSLVSTSASQYSVVRHNPLSLLSSSLKTFSVSAVQETILSLQCPHSHRILIISALMEAKLVTGFFRNGKVD